MIDENKIKELKQRNKDLEHSKDILKLAKTKPTTVILSDKTVYDILPSGQWIRRGKKK